MVKSVAKKAVKTNVSKAAVKTEKVKSNLDYMSPEFRKCYEEVKKERKEVFEALANL